MNNKHSNKSFLQPLSDKAMDNLMNLSRECKAHPRDVLSMVLEGMDVNTQAIKWYLKEDK